MPYQVVCDPDRTVGILTIPDNWPEGQPFGPNDLITIIADNGDEFEDSRIAPHLVEQYKAGNEHVKSYLKKLDGRNRKKAEADDNPFVTAQPPSDEEDLLARQVASNEKLGVGRPT